MKCRQPHGSNYIRSISHSRSTDYFALVPLISVFWKSAVKKHWHIVGTRLFGWGKCIFEKKNNNTSLKKGAKTSGNVWILGHVIAQWNLILLHQSALSCLKLQVRQCPYRGDLRGRHPDDVHQQQYDHAQRHPPPLGRRTTLGAHTVHDKHPLHRKAANTHARAFVHQLKTKRSGC